MCTRVQNINYSTEHCYQMKALDHGMTYYETCKFLQAYIHTHDVLINLYLPIMGNSEAKVTLVLCQVHT